MGMRVAANIVIGGKLPASKLGELMQAIEADGVNPGYENEFENLETYLRTNGAEGGCGLNTCGVDLCAHEVNYGDFDAIEGFCRENGLAYRKEYDGYGGEWGPGLVIVGSQDGKLDGTHILGGDNGPPVMSVVDLHKFSHIQFAIQRLEQIEQWKPPALEIVEEIAQPAEDAFRVRSAH